MAVTTVTEGTFPSMNFASCKSTQK